MKRRLPKPLRLQGSYIHEAEHVLSLDGKHYDMARVFRSFETRESVWISLDVLTPLFKNPASKASGFSERRLRLANTRYPLIIDPSGKILDGRHRFVKMRRAGRKRAQVHFISATQLRRFECRKYSGKLVR